MSRIDDILELLNAVLSFIYAFMFSVETYYITIENNINDISSTPPFIKYIDIFIIIYILADYILFFFLHHENRMQYFFSFDSFITYITVVPTALIRFEVIENIA